MDEKELGFMDYINIIWERRIFIIVVTLACMLTGVIVCMMKQPIYRSEALVRIGKGGTTTIPTLIDKPENLATTIPINYSGVMGSGYSLRVSTHGSTPLIRIFVEGPEGNKAKEYLEKVVLSLVKDHRKMTEDIVESYRILARGIGEYIEVVGDQMTQFGVSDKRTSTIKDSAVKVDIMNSLWERKVSLTDLKRESEYKMYVNSLRTNMTKVVGSVTASRRPVEPNKKKYVIFAFLFGFALSLLMAFFKEYQRKVAGVKGRMSKS